MKIRNTGWFVAAVASVSLLAAGCGASTSTSATPASVTSITLPGGVQVEPNWWFPISPASVCSTVNGDTNGLMYRPLLFISKTDGIDYKRSIASSVTPSDNDTVFTIKLNPNWKWSNGDPVTAQDVALGYNILIASSYNNSVWEQCGAGIGGVPNDFKSGKVTGTDTFVVTTTTPVNPTWFIHNGLGQLIPIPQVWNKYPNNMTQELKFIQKYGNSPYNKLFDVVDGPYKFGGFKNNDYWKLVANPNYTGPTKAKITSITFEYFTSSAAQFAAMRRHEFPEAGLPNSFYKDRGELSPYYVTKSSTPGFCFNYMQPNFSTQAAGIGGMFNKLYFRQALQMGIDQTAMIADLQDGSGAVMHGVIPSTPPNKYYDPATINYGYNPAKGKALLESHGWKENSSGVMERNGVTLAFPFIIASGSTTLTNEAELMKADWAKEGIDVTIQSVPFNQAIADATQTAPQVSKWALIWWGGGWCYEPDYYPTGGGLFKPGSAANYGAFNNPTLTALINKTYAPATPAQAQKALDAYQLEAAKLLPVIFVPEDYGFLVENHTLHGLFSAYNPITTMEWYNHWTD
jgi:peptide/nickel transport system substrate-binding protein